MGNDVASDSPVHTFFARLEEYSDRAALYWRGDTHTYADLLDKTAAWQGKLGGLGIGAGTVVAYVGDYWPEVIPFTLGLIRVGAIAVPFSAGVEREVPKLTQIAEAELLLRFTPDGEVEVKQLAPSRAHPLVAEFRVRQHPGCIVFTSGSSGQPKGILHDFERLLTKFAKPRTAYRTLLFLL